MKRVALYTRVSTSEQSPESQLQDLRALAQQRGLLIVEEYTDCGISGAKTSRPALRVLRVVVEYGTCSQAQVITETGFGKHKVSKIICQLYERRLLRRRIDRLDSRKHDLRAGSEAKQLLARLDDLTEHELQRARLDQEVKLPSEPASSKLPASEQHGEAAATISFAEAGETNPADALSEGKHLLARIDHLTEEELQGRRLDPEVNLPSEPPSSKPPASEQHAEMTAITSSAEAATIKQADAVSEEQTLLEWIVEHY